MKKNKISVSKDIRLAGKTRAQIISLLGDNCVEDADGNIIYSTRFFLFLKKKIFIGFDKNDVADVVFTK